MAAADRLAGPAGADQHPGLCRHRRAVQFQRAGAALLSAQRPEQGDLQINLLPKGERDRASHAIALDIRQRLADLPRPAGTAIEVVEVPPGPPVLATLLAEVYGPDAGARRAAAAQAASGFPAGRFHRRCRRHGPCAGGAAALRHRP